MKFLMIKFLFLSFSTVAQAITLNQYKQQLINLSDADLWAKAATGLVGACRLNDARACTSCSCDYYAQTTYTNSTGYNGLPFNPSTPVAGTGCFAFKGSTSPTCWSGWSSWGPYSICAANLTERGANIIRDQLSLDSDVCKLADYVATLTPPDGGTLGKMVNASKFVWPDPGAGQKINPRECYAYMGKPVTSASGTITPLVKQQSGKCFKAMMRIRLKNLSSGSTNGLASIPKISLTSESVQAALDLGSLSEASYATAVSEVYIAANTASLAQVEIFDKNLIEVQRQLDMTPVDFLNDDYLKLSAQMAWWQKAKAEYKISFSEASADQVSTAILDEAKGKVSKMSATLSKSLSASLTDTSIKADEIANKLNNEIIPAQNQFMVNLRITNPDPAVLKNLVVNRMNDMLLKMVLSSSGMSSATYDTPVLEMLPYTFKVPPVATSPSTSVASTSTPTTTTAVKAEPVVATFSPTTTKSSYTKEAMYVEEAIIDAQPADFGGFDGAIIK
jgi:hypothetical protein